MKLPFTKYDQSSVLSPQTFYISLTSKTKSVTFWNRSISGRERLFAFGIKLASSLPMCEQNIPDCFEFHANHIRLDQQRWLLQRRSPLAGGGGVWSTSLYRLIDKKAMLRRPLTFDQRWSPSHPTDRSLFHISLKMETMLCHIHQETWSYINKSNMSCPYYCSYNSKCLLSQYNWIT